jgi:putative phosphoesterase
VGELESSPYIVEETNLKQITIFGDIHANLPALEAVLADIEARRLENLYCLGDLVGYGVWPNEVIETIHARRIPTIMGNYDLGVGHDSDDCGCAYRTPAAQALGERSIAWSNSHTSAGNKAYLRRLVDNIPLQLGDLKVLLVHGSPRRINEYLYEDRPESSLERLLDLAEADVLVCGHTHLPYQRLLGSGRQVINAGSVGKPKDDNPDACYLLLSAQGRDLTADFIRVPYDVERAAQAIEASEMPDEFAEMLRLGRG